MQIELPSNSETALLCDSTLRFGRSLGPRVMLAQKSSEGKGSIPRMSRGGRDSQKVLVLRGSRDDQKVLNNIPGI